MVHVIRKADAGACVVRRTFVLPLCVQKEIYCDTPCLEGRHRGAHRLVDICLDTLCLEEICLDTLGL